MKVIETKRYAWRDGLGMMTGDYIKVAPSKRNADGKEIAEWLKPIAGELNLVELPKFKSQAIVRYMDTETLKDGHLVAIYAVHQGGLYRDWIPVNTRYFGNTGRCTTLGCMSEKKMIESILRYKKGKKVDFAGMKAITNFYQRYLNMVRTGDSGRNFITRVLEEELDITLEDNWTIDDLNKICKTIVENGNYPNYNEDYMGYPDDTEKPNYTTF